MTVWLLGASGCQFSQASKIVEIDSHKAMVDARHTLRAAAEDESSSTRAKAIESLASMVGPSAGGVYTEALNDPEPNVRFSAAMAIGDLRYEPAKSKLLQMARFRVSGAEPDTSVYCAVIYALYRLGNVEHAPDLGKLLFHKSREVRSNVALVMGKMGEPSAVPVLKALLGAEKNRSVKLQVLESLAMLDDERSRLLLGAHIQNSSMMEKIVAVEAAGWMRGKQAKIVLKEILYSTQQPVRMRALAAGSLGRLGIDDHYGYNLCFQSAYAPGRVMKSALDGKKPEPEDVRSLRQIAVMSLGWMKRPRAVAVIYPLLKSRDGVMRVAAAVSILRLLKDHPGDGADSAVVSQGD